MMFVIGVLVTILGASSAVDLTGCHPQMPKIIDGLRQPKGDIYSPGYTNNENYPDNMFCEYEIHAPYGFRIKLEFRDMDIENADMCQRDAVELRDTSTPNEYLILGVFCGNQTYPPVISEGNKVSIFFRSDFLIGRPGFRIHYTVSTMPSYCDDPRQTPCRNGYCYNLEHRCNGKDECGDGSDEELCGFPLPVTECGLRNASRLYDRDRIVGGEEAEPGSWPWQADVQMSIIHPNGHNCGGTLINAQWVVSAAHCFQQARHPSQLRIHFGNHHKFKKDEGEQVRFVERIIVFPGTTGEELLRFMNLDIVNDVALLKLTAPVKFTNSVRPACLPAQGYEVPVGTKCMATGWGMTRGTGASHALKEVELSIQNDQVCIGEMGPINKKTMICVRNSKGFNDVCHGDSGGPLVCEVNGKWQVVGATSYGTFSNYLGGLCALPGSATVYAKLSDKTNWIRQQISKYS